MGNTNSVIEQNALRPPIDCLGNNVEKPAFPQHAVYSERMKSFETWHEDLPVRKEELVEAGLMYIGADDRCRCYHCGGGFKNWQPGHNPMREHAKLYPKCPHVLLVKGQAYIDAVINGEMVEDNASQNVADISLHGIDYLTTPACLSCTEMGFSEENVKKAVRMFILKNKHSDFKGADICKILFELGDNPDYEIQATVETDREPPENTIRDNLNIHIEENELEETTLCKVCVDKRADVSFLPCRHMMCCAQCAIAMTKCPICSKNIQGQFIAM